MVAPGKNLSQEPSRASEDGTPRLRLAPTRALIVLAAVALVVPALAELVVQGAERALILAAFSLVVVAALDALAGTGRARGVTALMPGLTRLTLGRAGQVTVEFRNTAKHAVQVRVGLQTPDDLGVEPVEPALDLESGGAGVRVDWRCLPRRRGSFRLEHAHVEIRSVLGLWTVRWVTRLGGEARVYPDLRGEGRQVSALFMRRSSVGTRLQRMVGRGREFEKLREYLPGDGYDEIHWKATAKRGHPVTKVFQVERTQEVYAVVDASRLSGRVVEAGVKDGAATTLLERQINAALALALAAERQGDLFGLVTYAATPRGFLRAKNGAAHFQACREAMVSLQSEPVSPDLGEVCTFLRTRLTKRALLLFLVSLDDPALAESFIDAVQVIARHHVVVVASPRPPDAQPLFNGEPPADVDAAYARLGGHMRWQGLQDLGGKLHHAGVHLALLERDSLAAGAISQYMALKQRQLI